MTLKSLSPIGVAIESFFNVISKNDGLKVRFVLNNTQRFLDASLTGRDLVPKARQEGVSTYVLARFCVRCLTESNIKCAIISHEKESTQRLLQRAQFFYETMRGPMKPKLSKSSANVIQVAETGSEIYIGTAGSRAFGRGDTINALHCSEYPMWPDPANLITGLLEAVPLSGEVIIEATGKGPGDDYHSRCMQAVSGNGVYRVHFIPWTMEPEYSLPITKEQTERLMSSLDPDIEEPDLAHILSPGQLLWRRMKLSDMGYDLIKFKREYPLYLHECFAANEYSVFYRVFYEETYLWVQYDQNTYILDGHPKQGYAYAMGVDPAGGTGAQDRDNACIQIICTDTNEQVAEFTSKSIPPDHLASHINRLGRMFNNAYIVVESNNYGLVTLDNLRKVYPKSLIFASGSAYGSSLPEKEYELTDMGFRTSSRTKPLLIGRLQRDLGDGMRIHSEALRGELSTFVETDKGTMEAIQGCHDDRVMALACANWGVPKAVSMNQSSIIRPDLSGQPFMLENLLAELEDCPSPLGPSPNYGNSLYAYLNDL